MTGFQSGDNVWGFNDMGLRSQAEYLVVSTHRAVAPMPKGLNFGEAVACIEGAFYAENIVNKVTVGPGSAVLVNGATGAIGSAVLQLSRNRGAIVTAVGNTPNLELLRSLGASKVVDYLHEDFTQDTATYDYVFDAVGKSTFGQCRRLLNPKGVYISSELGPGCHNLALALVTPAFGGRTVIFPFPSNIKGFLASMTVLVEAGNFRPVVDRTYSLNAVVEAYEYVASGRKTGNVLLSL
ncbi:MAG: NAD(P)-dependent alcohol dehydrogenase [Nannocystaceae bacterium]